MCKRPTIIYICGHSHTSHKDIKCILLEDIDIDIECKDCPYGITPTRESSDEKCASCIEGNGILRQQEEERVQKEEVKRRREWDEEYRVWWVEFAKWREESGQVRW